ncbi:MAG: FtsQ-type POTRA domain-containing protein, partial [Sedimenticolaceae bacterium]
MAPRTSIRQQQKQKLQQQARRRRWLASLGMAIGFGVLLGGGAFGYHHLTQPGRLPLRVIEVNGELSQLEHEQIQRTVVAAIDGGFFSCDMPRLRAAVLAMPWVEDVSIRRAWPDRLRMVVSEQVPLARWGDDALININGGVFRP